MKFLTKCSEIYQKFDNIFRNVFDVFLLFVMILDVFGRRDPQNRIGLEKPVSGHHLNPQMHINEGIIGVFPSFLACPKRI